MKKYWWLLLVFVLSLWAIAPLFRSGFFPMHDDEQIARLYELHQALSSRQFPPRWVGNLGFGYGYPFYNFYPPLVYYLGEIFYLLGFSLITSTKIVMGLGFFLSGIFIYLLAKEFFGKVAGLVAAVFYIYAPYHALDLYVRGALAEFYAFVFLPAVFWSTLRLIKEKSKKWFIINSLFLSLLLLSHNFVALILMPFYFVFLVFFLYFEKKKRRAVLLVSASLILFLSLTCYFWLPALAEKKYTLVDTILTRELASYKLHFVYFRQLWHSPWGYGGSIFGLEDGISFEVGKPHLVLSFLAGIFGFFLLLKRKRRGPLFTFYFLLFTFSLFMTSFHSQFIWDRIKPLWYLQFPWRFLLFTALFSSLLSGGVIELIFRRLKKKKKLKWIIVFIPLALVIFLHQSYFKPSRYLEVNDGHYTTEEDLKWRVSGFSFEFIPKGVATMLSDIETTQVDIKKEEIPKKSYEVVGNIKVKEEKLAPHIKKFSVDGEGGILTINTYNFPGWEVRIDGEVTAINDDNKFKLITIKVPPGMHIVEAQFKNTPVRTAGNLISLISWMGLFGFVLIQKKRASTSPRCQ